MSHRTKSSDLLTRLRVKTHHILVFNIHGLVVGNAINRTYRVDLWVS